jgi:hypothetical protein
MLGSERPLHQHIHLSELELLAKKDRFWHSLIGSSAQVYEGDITQAPWSLSPLCDHFTMASQISGSAGACFCLNIDSC